MTVTDLSSSARPTADLPTGAVVVGIDGSHDADLALAWAARQCLLLRRPLALVHAYRLVGSVWLDQAGIDSREVLDAVGDDACTLLQDARGRVLADHPDLEVVLLMRADDPRSMLEDLSRHASLLVLGSRGRGPVASLLLGSVSVAVARHAHCPVVVVRPGAAVRRPGRAGRGAHPDDRPRGGVLVGVDGTPGSLAVVEFGYQQAALRGLPLEVLHCVWDVRATAAGLHRAPAEDPEVADVRALLSEAVAGLAERHPGVDVTLTVAYGLADDEIVAASRGRDLTVVGYRPGSPVRSLLLGSVAPAVLEHADGAVAVVPVAPLGAERP